jgi:molybdopterin-binding protein
MELSARNQLEGTVKRVSADGVMAEVVIDIGGSEVVSTITKASADRLKLKNGDRQSRRDRWAACILRNGDRDLHRARLRESHGQPVP